MVLQSRCNQAEAAKTSGGSKECGGDGQRASDVSQCSGDNGNESDGVGVGGGGETGSEGEEGGNDDGGSKEEGSSGGKGDSGNGEGCNESGEDEGREEGVKGLMACAASSTSASHKVASRSQMETATFTPEQEEKFQKRHEEGYDLYDPEYVSWLERNHPESLPPDRYTLAPHTGPLLSSPDVGCPPENIPQSNRSPHTQTSPSQTLLVPSLVIFSL